VFTDQDHPDLRFQLGLDPVKLIMVIKNETNTPIATARGFSQAEFHRALIVTDPGGVRHVVGEGHKLHKMDPPFFLNARPWGQAEALPAGWVRSVTVADLRDYVPVMKTTAGWYTIQAQQPFVRFASTGQYAGLGFLGALDHPDNWHGTVNSNIKQIFLAPSEGGAQVEVRVLDQTVDPPKPLAQVSVRVFERGEPPEPYNLADLWRKGEPVMRGATNFEGRAIWRSGSPCIPQGDYTAVALYSNQYEESRISAGKDEGWRLECGGSIERVISFGGPVVLGDINGDGCCDVTDLDLALAHVRGPAPHDPSYDFNGDGEVNIADCRYLVTLFTNPKGTPCD
jgi:hypothetical protein